MSFPSGMYLQQCGTPGHTARLSLQLAPVPSSASSHFWKKKDLAIMIVIASIHTVVVALMVVRIVR